MKQNQNCHIRIYKTRQWVSTFKCMCAVNVQINCVFFKVEIYKYCIKTSFFNCFFFIIISKVLCRESLRRRIFFLLLFPLWNTPHNHPIYRILEVLAHSHIMKEACKYFLRHMCTCTGACTLQNLIHFGALFRENGSSSSVFGRI